MTTLKKRFSYKKFINCKKIAFSFLFIALLVFFFLLIRDIRLAKNKGTLDHHRSVVELLKRNKEAHRISQQDVSLIDLWMTFRYINTIFDLPETYLCNALNIQDPRYPNITIEKYAKNQNLNPQEFLIQLKNSVSNYLSANKLENNRQN
jgi:hypothetical protein